MNSKLYSFLFAFFVITTLQAQLHLPLQFKEDVVKWSELSWMDGQNSHDQWVYMASPPKIIRDTVYLFMNYYQKEVEDGKNYGYCGYIIKKLNIKSGEKYWETQRKYKEYGNRKILSKPLFKDGTIEIALYDESHAIGINTVWHQCYPASITIDRSKGQIIDSNYVDKTDMLLPRLRSFGEVNINNETRPTIYKTEEGFSHILSWLNEFLKSNIDNNGTLNHLDSIKFPKRNYDIWSQTFERVTSDTFWFVMFNKATNWADIEVLIARYNKDWNLDTVYNVSEHFVKPYTSGGVYFIDNGYFVVGTKYNDLINKTLKESEYMFDKSGNFIDSISFTLKPGIDDTIRYGWLRPLVDRKHNRLLMTQSRQNHYTESTYFEMYENIGDSLHRINRVHVEGVRDHFRVNYATMLENGDILMYIQQFTDPINNGDHWFSWLMLDGEKMNIISSSHDVVQNTRKHTLYPNPTSGTIHINGLETPVSVTISNVSGLRVKVCPDVTDEVDISDLPAGMYILDIRGKDFRERHKVVKVE